jgi:hypothetical protein
VYAGSNDQRPITDFLDEQGTTSEFHPPVPDYIGWISALARPPVYFALVDYAGLAAEYLANLPNPIALGTTTQGTVTDRPLRDGRSQVSVVLRTTNALTWAAANADSGPLVFGYRAADLAANPALTPALSESQLHVVFKNTAQGDPLPDLVDAFILGNASPGQELVSIAFRSNGTGPLRAAFGVAEGTRGRCIVSQTGLFMTGFHGAVADGFPAENVELRALGR